jgi:uncharacterized protein (DUF433 family)
LTANNLRELTQVIHSDPEILDGTPVFVGTRVPVQTLLLYLESGETIDEFLDNFPTVSKAQAVAFLEEGGRALVLEMNVRIERQLIADAQNPDAWEAVCEVPGRLARLRSSESGAATTTKAETSVVEKQKNR